jgi:hypothetical protein
MSDEGHPYLRKRAAKANLSNSHKRAPKQEKSLALRLRGLTTAASGSREVKGDVRVRRVLRLEAKTTKNKSFSVTLEMVRKIEEAAAGGAELPAIVVEFHDGFGRPIAEVAVVPTYVLDEIADR